jgi:ABC-type transport system involved in multi-copper enzyme maturation permease subunit
MLRIKNILTIAKNTFRETIRDRVLYAILVFAFVFLAFTAFLGTISLGTDLHIIKSLGLAGMYLFSLIITVFLGTSLMYKEIEKRTLYFVLAKPITRGEIIIGKFFGLLASVALSVAGMFAVYIALVAYRGGGFDAIALLSGWYTLLDLSVLIALSILFSTFATPLAGSMYAMVLIYAGHSLDSIIFAVRNSSAFVKGLAQVLYTVLPNLEKFNIRDSVIYGSHPSIVGIALVTAYAAVYCILLLFIAVLSFRSREL